jgi:hypothetical protein
MLNNLNSERMKTAKQILSDITGYTVEELTERNTEPLLQAEDCLTAMYCFLAQQQANGVEQSDSNCKNFDEIDGCKCKECGYIWNPYETEHFNFTCCEMCGSDNVDADF